MAKSNNAVIPWKRTVECSDSNRMQNGTYDFEYHRHYAFPTCLSMCSKIPLFSLVRTMFLMNNFLSRHGKCVKLSWMMGNWLCFKAIKVSQQSHNATKSYSGITFSCYTILSKSYGDTTKLLTSRITWKLRLARSW